MSFFNNSLLNFFATTIKLLTSLVTFHYFCKNFDFVDEYIRWKLGGQNDYASKLAGINVAKDKLSRLLYLSSWLFLQLYLKNFPTSLFAIELVASSFSAAEISCNPGLSDNSWLFWFHWNQSRLSSHYFGDHALLLFN